MPVDTVNVAVLKVPALEVSAVGAGYAVFYRPLKPAESKVVYSMDEADPDMALMPPRAFVELKDALLFTGP